MNTADVLFESSIPELPLIGRGKVRDIYSVDDNHLLIVTTDRLSAFDVVMPDPVPGKGAVLTEISLFWFRMMSDIVETQLTDLTVADVVKDPQIQEQLAGRALVVKRLKPLPIEAVVRGYLIGSGWKDYQDSGQVCGIDLPEGMRQAEKLPQTLFTPAYKAEAGAHDENIKSLSSSAKNWLPVFATSRSKSTSALPLTRSSAASSSPTRSSNSDSMNRAACILSTRC